MPQEPGKNVKKCQEKLKNRVNSTSLKKYKHYLYNAKHFLSYPLQSFTKNMLIDSHNVRF